MFTLWWRHLWPLQTHRCEKYHFWIGENLHAQTSQGHLHALKAQRSNTGIKVKRILKIQRIFIVFLTEGADKIHRWAFFHFYVIGQLKLDRKVERWVWECGRRHAAKGSQSRLKPGHCVEPCWASTRWAKWAPSQMHIYIIMVLGAMMHHRVHKRVQEEVVPTLNSMFKN